MISNCRYAKISAAPISKRHQRTQIDTERLHLFQEQRLSRSYVLAVLTQSLRKMQSTHHYHEHFAWSDYQESKSQPRTRTTRWNRNIGGNFIRYSYGNNQRLGEMMIIRNDFNFITKAVIVWFYNKIKGFDPTFLTYS